MMEKIWTLDVGSNQYDLIGGKFYLIGHIQEQDDGESYVDIGIKSQSVDPKHCLLDVSGDALFIYDLCSKLGTFLNGKRLVSMRKECITAKAELRFGEEIATLYPKENSVDYYNTMDTFLAPTHRAPRSSLANTSTRLFSSPDVSLLGDVRDRSFNIPETQHIKRVSIENIDKVNSSSDPSDDGNSFADESFIPETQMHTTEQVPQELQETDLHKESEMIRICTQDFNENLFGSVEEDDNMFSSIVVPNIKHNPVVLMHSSTIEHIDKDESQASNAEIEVLNCSAQTSKKDSSDGTTLISECVERDDVCTPDLFDLPELAQINIQIATEETNIISQENDKAEPHVADSNKINSADSQAQPINDAVSGGDGYAEEIDMMQTQVFVPIAKQVIQVEPPREEPATANGVELSLSGKENIPRTDFQLEQTQIFAPFKDLKSVESKCNSTSSDAKEAPKSTSREGNVSLLEPTQVFATRELKKLNQIENGNGSTISTPLQKFNSTPVSTKLNEERNDVTSFFGEIEHSSKITEVKDTKSAAKLLDNFKKPKQSMTSSKSISSRGSKEKSCSINSSQSEMEDLYLCTPKWITDNFDELSVDRNISAVKKHILFGSDSEDESLELNKLTTKKDSKDFERLLSNVEEAKPVKNITKLIKSSSTNVSKPINNVTNTKRSLEHINEKVDGEKTEKVESIIKENNIAKKHKKKEQASKPSSSFDTNEAVLANKIGQNRERAESKKDPEPSEIKRPLKTSSKDQEHTETAVSNKRLTRLRSRASDPEIDKASSSTGPLKVKQRKVEHIDEPKIDKASSSTGPSKVKQRKVEHIDELKIDKASSSTGPSKVKQRKVEHIDESEIDKASSSTGPSKVKKRKVEHIDEPETSKKRLTRSRSKIESQESTASAKSTSSSRRTTRRKNSLDEQAQAKIDSCRGKNTDESAKSVKTIIRSETHSAPSTSDRNRKHAPDKISNDEPKQLSNARTLKVAMTMVEPKLFQTLVDNSPGNWCVASDPTDADVLVMDKGNRTLKFLIATAKGIPIVTSKWLETFNSTRTVPRGVTHFFRDQEFEKRHKFSLFKSLELARKGKLFEGYDFLTTPSILPQPAEMKQIIECAGGKVHTEPPSPNENQKIYLISTMKDKKYWHKYRRDNNNIRITDSEGLMSSVMRQTTQPLVSNIFA